MAQEKWDYVVSVQSLHALMYPEQIVLMFKDSVKYQLHSVVNSGYWFDRLRVLFGHFMAQATHKDSWDEEILLVPTINHRYWTITDFYTWCRGLGFKCEVLGYRVPYSVDFTDKVRLGSWRSQSALYRMIPEGQ